MSLNRKEFDVIIIGGGVSGASLFYQLTTHTPIKKVLLLEKCDELGKVNSRKTHNSQTLHFGDIETNYTLAKATAVKKSTDQVKDYLEMIKNENPEEGKRLFSKYSKMVLAVGTEQVTDLKRRYLDFKHLFPGLRLIDRAEIARLEPKVVDGRHEREEIMAIMTDDGYTVDFGELAKSFVRRGLAAAAMAGSSSAEVHLNTHVDEIRPIAKNTSTPYRYEVRVGNNVIRAKYVAVAAGGHSLLMAHRMGYGKQYSILSVAGSFFWAPKVLNGKVYTMQVDKLPFAAIHGDPDVHDAQETRFGPTAKAIPMLERYNWSSVAEYFETFGLRWSAILSLMNILKDRVVFCYIMKNFLYDIPFFGRWLFLQEVKKIVPKLKLSELRYAKGMGGTRPQVVNTNTKALEMGEAKIEGDHILFNITPSPGASTCLGNAIEDAKKIAELLR